MTYRVLVAMDGSPASDAALSEIERVVRGGAGVHLLHVVPMLPWTVNTTSAGVMAGHDQALSYLGGLREKLPDVRGLNLIRTGDPAVAVLQAALEFDVDLIAMGTHGRTGASKWFLGSVAETVMREARIPVLLSGPGIVPAGKALRRILVPLDGSDESLTILPAVKSLAIRTAAEVVFLHVSERAPLPLLESRSPAGSGAPGDPKAGLLRLADRLEHSDLEFWQMVAPGDPVEEIVSHAETLEVDLIAMTLPAGKDKDTTTVGSTAMGVMERSGRAAILQRPAARALDSKAWRFQ